MRSTYHYRSFFWPALLILVGVIALLANTGQIPAERLYNLVGLWPLVLIVVGLELIVRRSMRGVAGDVAAALIILLAIVGATAYVVASPTTTASHSLDSTMDLGNISSATVEIDAGAGQVTISGASDLGSSLYKAHIDYSGSKPEITLDRSSGELRIDQPNRSIFGLEGPRFVLNLQLNPSIPWTINQNTGASTSTYNLSAIHLSGMSLNTGASRIEMTLGQPSGIVSLQINGGSLTVRVHRPKGVATSVDLSGGALSLDADGQGYHAIGHVSVGSETATDGYKIEISGGACNVTLDASPATD
jgi:hypothetical protein